MKRVQIRTILKKAPKQRTEEDLDLLMEVLREIEFFRSKPELTYGDLRELAQTFSYEVAEADQTLFKEGDPAEKFYLILEGSVSVVIKNQIIDQWEWARTVYTALKKWKENEFDTRVETAMRLHFRKY